MLYVSIISPTYNECDNVPKFAKELFEIIKTASDIDVELIIVDDNSPDRTGEVAEDLTKIYPMKVLHRPGKMGLGSAVMDGFKLSDRELLRVMDADLSPDPAILIEMIQSLKDYDLVSRTRFGAASLVEDWPLLRKLTSHMGVWFAQKITKISDPLSGYFFLHRNVLGDMALTSPGYKILFEILVKGHYKKVKEIPYHFRTREHSSSKLNSQEYLLFLKQLILFSFRARK